MALCWAQNSLIRRTHTGADIENRLRFAAPKNPQAGSIGWWYKYDQLGRRVRKYSTLWDPTLNGGQGAWQTVPNWPPVEDYRYVYDGWNLVLELDATSWGGAGVPPVKRRYTWGLDLSGTLQGAGGIGGLLVVEDHSGGTGVPPVSRLYFYDANGNVGQLVDAGDGDIVARYEYDPYGNAQLNPTDAEESGSYAASNPFRFSTKYLDAETGFPYFGYRYLDPPLGRWTSRDPAGEQPSTNLHSFVGNTPLSAVDPDGRLIVLLEGNRSLGSGVSGERELNYIGNWIRALSRSPRPHNIFFISGPTALFADNSLQQEWLKSVIEDYSRQRDRLQICGVMIPPLIVIGFSDGATTIYNVLNSGTLNGRIDFVGMIDMVRANTFSGPNDKPGQVLDLANRFTRGFNAFQQSDGILTDGWKGFLFRGGQLNNRLYIEVWTPPNGVHKTVGHVDSLFQVGIIKQSLVQWDIIDEAIK